MTTYQCPGEPYTIGRAICRARQQGYFEKCPACACASAAWESAESGIAAAPVLPGLAAPIAIRTPAVAPVPFETAPTLEPVAAAEDFVSPRGWLDYDPLADDPAAGEAPADIPARTAGTGAPSRARETVAGWMKNLRQIYNLF
ncbi:MAG: hypothetical protein HY608_10750 [Planctomycetes bacterium]|nr:hypothetical protein [Planctomycetota bacterium]